MEAKYIKGIYLRLVEALALISRISISNTLYIIIVKYYQGYLPEASGGVRTSLCKISRSRDPELRLSPFQAKAPTRAVWPSRTLTRLFAITSQTCT